MLEEQLKSIAKSHKERNGAERALYGEVTTHLSRSNHHACNKYATSDPIRVAGRPKEQRSMAATQTLSGESEKSHVSRVETH